MYWWLMFTSKGAPPASSVPASAGSARPPARRRQVTNSSASAAASVTSTDSSNATCTVPTRCRSGTKNSPSHKIAGGRQTRVWVNAPNHEPGSRRRFTHSWIDAMP